MGVLRVASWLLASVALAGCGGSSADRRGTPAELSAIGKVVNGEVRMPDARSPLIRATGVWRCATPGRVQLRVSPHGLASLSRGGGLLAHVWRSRALINRSCASRRTRTLPPFRPARAVGGESLLNCAVPRRVLVDLRSGDLTVREPRRGRFLLGAAVSVEHIEAAGHWSASCSVDRSAG